MVCLKIPNDVVVSYIVYNMFHLYCNIFKLRLNMFSMENYLIVFYRNFLNETLNSIIIHLF